MANNRGAPRYYIPYGPFLFVIYINIFKLKLGKMYRKIAIMYYKNKRKVRYQ